MIKRFFAIFVIVLISLTTLHYFFKPVNSEIQPISLTFLLNELSDFEPIITFEDTAAYYTSLTDLYDWVSATANNLKNYTPWFLDWYLSLYDFSASVFVSVFMLIGILFNSVFYIISFFPFLFSLFM